MRNPVALVLYAMVAFLSFGRSVNAQSNDNAALVQQQEQERQRRLADQQRQEEAARQAVESARLAEEQNRQYQQAQAEYQVQLKQQQDVFFRQQREDEARQLETQRRDEAFQAQQRTAQQQADLDWQSRVQALIQPQAAPSWNGDGVAPLPAQGVVFPRRPAVGLVPLQPAYPTPRAAAIFAAQQAASQHWNAVQQQRWQAVQWQAQMRFEAARLQQMRHNAMLR